MKKSLFKAVFVLVCVITLVFSVSCKEKLDVERMLDYQAEMCEHDITLRVGDMDYPIHIALGEFDGSHIRDGRAVITGGVLENVSFDMNDGALKMTVGELEYPLKETDSSALYALFSAFSISKDNFVGATTESDVKVLVARFSGKGEFTLTLNADTYKPVKIECSCDAGVCLIDFGAQIKEE